MRKTKNKVKIFSLKCYPKGYLVDNEQLRQKNKMYTPKLQLILGSNIK